MSENLLALPVQQCAKHVLWALSQQRLPGLVVEHHVVSCCALLLDHMELPLNGCPPDVAVTKGPCRYIRPCPCTKPACPLLTLMS